MKEQRKIKEIYHCSSIVSDEELYPLQKWHNQLIEKTIPEITVADVLRMMRQKLFMNLAMSRAIYFVSEDVFIGEVYDGELLEKISEMDSSFLLPYKDNLIDITKKALEKSVMHELSCDGEEDEIKRSIKIIAKKLEDGDC